jgi:hypothetical protein
VITIGEMSHPAAAFPAGTCWLQRFASVPILRS